MTNFSGSSSLILPHSSKSKNISNFRALEMKTNHMSPASTSVILPTNKEDISALRFPSEEVLMSPEKIQERKILLERSVVLGNTYKGKTRIIFEDMECIRQIETHLWGLTDKRVILKQGIVLPIHRIHEVKL